jgi:hypothetical protein
MPVVVDLEQHPEVQAAAAQARQTLTVVQAVRSKMVAAQEQVLVVVRQQGTLL